MHNHHQTRNGLSELKAVSAPSKWGCGLGLGLLTPGGRRLVEKIFQFKPVSYYYIIIITTC